MSECSQISPEDVRMQWRNCRATIDRLMGKEWMDRNDPYRNVYLPGLLEKAIRESTLRIPVLSDVTNSSAT